MYVCSTFNYSLLWNLFIFLVFSRKRQASRILTTARFTSKGFISMAIHGTIRVKETSRSVECACVHVYIHIIHIIYIYYHILLYHLLRGIYIACFRCIGYLLNFPIFMWYMLYYIYIYMYTCREKQTC